MWTLAKAAVAGVTVVIVSDVSQRFPRLGALLLTLPVLSIVALVITWQQYGDLRVVSRLSQETLILVPLGLPFFVPLAFAEKLGIGFWLALGLGLLLASATIGLWFYLGPKPG